MNTENLINQLYEKMAEEQEKYREWLLQQSPEEILNHSYEYTIREDILCSVENHGLSEVQASALLQSPCPLADIYHDWGKIETDHMENILYCIENRANAVIEREWRKNIAQVPVYPFSPEVAAENNASDLYRASLRANIACRNAIVSAIFDNYRDNRLEREGVEKVLAEFGDERVSYVLANTVQMNAYDMRYSDTNKQWANKFSIDQTLNKHFILDYAHPGVVNLFIDQVKELVQKQCVQEEIIGEDLYQLISDRREEFDLSVDDMKYIRENPDCYKYIKEVVDEILEEEGFSSNNLPDEWSARFFKLDDAMVHFIKQAYDEYRSCPDLYNKTVSGSEERSQKVSLSDQINSAENERKAPEKDSDKQEPVR